MPAKETKQELVLVNVIEEFVRLKALDTLENFGGCTCKTCQLNVSAIALNKLTPRYVTTTTGELLERITALELGNSTEILVEVTKAAIMVKDSPRH